MDQLYYDIFLTELGWMGALATPQGLSRLTLRASPQEALEELGPVIRRARHDPAALDSIRAQLEGYARGEKSSLNDVALDLADAPPFFRAAWEKCRTIPPGETRSYAWLAAAAGRPGAFRAAGLAMARNRLAVIIPCHRVIGSDGGLHGYAGGLAIKARLLELERRSAGCRP